MDLFIILLLILFLFFVAGGFALHVLWYVAIAVIVIVLLRSFFSGRV